MFDKNGRHNPALPKFRFRRHRTAASVFRMYCRNPEKPKEKVRLADIDFGDGISGVHAARSIRACGFWGFTETLAKPPIIHYWHDGKQTHEQMLIFFAHEMGHCMGKPIKGKQFWPEEERADEYAAVAVLAMKAATRKGGGA